MIGRATGSLSYVTQRKLSIFQVPWCEWQRLRRRRRHWRGSYSRDHVGTYRELGNSDCRSNGSPRIVLDSQSRSLQRPRRSTPVHGFRSLIFALNQAKGKKRSRPSHHLVEFTMYEAHVLIRRRYFKICDVFRRHTHLYSEYRLWLYTTNAIIRIILHSILNNKNHSTKEIPHN